MDSHTARQLAEIFLRENVVIGGEELLIDESQTRETGHSWIFYYNTRTFLETRELRHALAGNAPVIVDKDTGETYFAAADGSLDQ
ncbi:MAG: YrhB domain-containing protein [Nitriliruptorales bacterium]